jgi:hypothetical protein
LKLRAPIAVIAGLERCVAARLRRHVLVAARHGPAARGGAQAERQVRPFCRARHAEPQLTCVPTRDACSAVPQRSASRRASVVPAPEQLPPIRTRQAPAERGASADRSGRAAAADGEAASPEAPATAAKRVAARLPRTSSAVFSVGSVPAAMFKPHRSASGAVHAPPADEPAREVLPGTAELLRARSLRAPPPAQGGGKLRSAMRALNAIATPRVLWKHGRAQQDATQAKENGLAR